MKYKSVRETVIRWGVSERIVRRYCTGKRIPGAVQIDKAWRIPANAVKPGTTPPPKQDMPKLLKKLISLRKRHGSRGLYDYVQVNMAYSNSRMASNRLTRKQVQYLYETDRVSEGFEPIKVNDIIEMRNHFVVMDMLLDDAMQPLSKKMIVQWQRQLLSESCRHKRKSAIEPGFRMKNCLLKSGQTPPPKEISNALDTLFSEYEMKTVVGLQDILELHVRFEEIRPFEDANGRIGRLLMFKECLRHDVMPFILDDKHRTGYLDGIRQWEANLDILMDVCMEAQIRFEAQMALQGLLECQSQHLRAYYKEGSR